MGSRELPSANWTCTRTFCKRFPPPIGQSHRLLRVFFALSPSFLLHKTGGFGGPAGGPYIVRCPTVHTARVRARYNITAPHRSVSSRQKHINTRPIMMIRERVPTSRVICVNILNKEHKKKSSSLPLLMSRSARRASVIDRRWVSTRVGYFQ